MSTCLKNIAFDHVALLTDGFDAIGQTGGGRCGEEGEEDKMLSQSVPPHFGSLSDLSASLILPTTTTIPTTIIIEKETVRRR